MTSLMERRETSEVPRHPHYTLGTMVALGVIGTLVAVGLAIAALSITASRNSVDDALVERAVQALRARGIGIVAAVGNDGPAAPAQYPASYPGVVAVTGVDARGRALPEAGKASHLDFAAPGADNATL